MLGSIYSAAMAPATSSSATAEKEDFDAAPVGTTSGAVGLDVPITVPFVVGLGPVLAMVLGE